MRNKSSSNGGGAMMLFLSRLLLVAMLVVVVVAAADPDHDGTTTTTTDTTKICFQKGRVSEGTTSSNDEVCFPMQTNIGDGQGEVIGKVCLSLVNSSESSSSALETNSDLSLQVTVNDNPEEWELIQTNVWVGNNVFKIPKLSDLSSVDVGQFPYKWPPPLLESEEEAEGSAGESDGKEAEEEVPSTWSLPNPCTTATTDEEEKNIMATSNKKVKMIFVVHSTAKKKTTTTTTSKGEGEEMVTLWGYEHLTRSVPAPWFDVKVICDC